MPFGLNNASATFQRLMNEILRDYLEKFIIVYLDNIMIFSKDKKSHKRHVRKVLNKIREARLKIKLLKYQWFKKEIKFVGHKISKEGIKLDEDNVKKIKECQPPKDVKGVRRFLGMAQYYRTFIKRFADIARPLYDLTRKDKEFEWMEAQQKAFEIIKKKLMEEPILAHPDWNKPFNLYTDASDTELGAILTQEDENEKGRVIAYEARTLNQNEKNYLTTEKECLAVVWAVEKFRHYLGGWKKFKIFTDHAVLKSLMNHENPTGRRYRWMEKLTEYNFL